MSRAGPCLEDGDDLEGWRECLCSQQWQMKGGTGRIWGQAAVSVNTGGKIFTQGDNLWAEILIFAFLFLTFAIGN